MRFAISACFAVVLLAGNTGCCLFCRPLFPCLARHRCDDCGMGCQRAPIFNWSRCCDSCDHCGDWTGQSIIARTGGQQVVSSQPGDSPRMSYAQSGRGRAKGALASRVVPGTYREVTAVEELGDAVEEEIVDEGPALVAEAPRAKRIRSSKSQPRRQVVRVQRIEE